MNLESKIEAVLFFKNEPVSVAELSKWLEEKPEDVKAALANLHGFYKDRGMVLMLEADEASFGTGPGASALIEKLQKDEFSRELGRAGLETLAIVLYKGPISRREIDHIRGVNSGFILRNLMIRGLIERTDPSALPGAGRSYSYKPTMKLLAHLGITRIEELPNYENAFAKVEEFVKTAPIETEQEDAG